MFRNAVGLLATIGSVSESEIFDRAEANSMFACVCAGNSKGRLEVDLLPADVQQRARNSIHVDGDAVERCRETCPGGGVAGLPDENSPNSDNNSPGAMAVTGFKSAASRMQAMGVCVALGSTAMTFVPLVAISVPAKAS